MLHVNVWLYVQHGETALHYAASGGHIDVIQLLCEKGMNVNVRDKVRRCPTCRYSLMTIVKPVINKNDVRLDVCIIIPI